MGCRGPPVKVRIDQHRGAARRARRRDAQHDVGEVAVCVGERPAGKHQVHRAAHLLAVHLRRSRPALLHFIYRSSGTHLDLRSRQVYASHGHTCP